MEYGTHPCEVATVELEDDESVFRRRVGGIVETEVEAVVVGIAFDKPLQLVFDDVLVVAGAADTPTELRAVEGVVDATAESFL